MTFFFVCMIAKDEYDEIYLNKSDLSVVAAMKWKYTYFTECVYAKCYRLVLGPRFKAIAGALDWEGCSDWRSVLVRPRISKGFQVVS